MSIYNSFAYQVLNNTNVPEFPNPSLAVEGAEILHAMPLQVQNKMHLYEGKPVIDYNTYKIWEKSRINFTGEKLEKKITGELNLPDGF